MRVTLHTHLYKNGHIDVDGVGDTKVDMEVVVGLQLANQSPITFRHGVLGGGGKSQEVMDLPTAMANRLKAFCQQHYVDRIVTFDCQSLVCHLMGWDGGSTKNRRSMSFSGHACQPNELVTGKPYAILPKREGDVTPHYMLGIPRKGYSLGVAGTNEPLLIASNKDLLRAYNGQTIIEIEKITYLS